MKKVSMCIGVFMAFFLVIGVYTAQAQDLTGFDGTWLKMTVKYQKGLAFTGYDSTAAPAKLKAGALNLYACVDVDAAEPTVPYLRIFDKNGTAIGSGALYWDAGTNLDFLGYLEASIATNVTYVPGDGGFPGTGTDTYLYGYVSVKGNSVDKIKVQSVSGEGYIQADDVTETTGLYTGFGYILNGGSTKDRRIPLISPACGAMVFPTP